ncbi:hypothetical protein [Tenacibaculum agarivorans]|uniref:hypothetical protein n=1 Tax=Tenacibaculum agarivorans TaxID=1908389 RepID=UPI00094BAE1B|nr:hypothetical protein [Tenacibaculum agarivorans]
MNNKGYISKKKKGSSLYEELHKEALEILQKLCGDVWTDYNEHDPGITLLENISYAITEVAYKANLPVEDLLHSSKKEPLVSGDNGFFTASDILTTSPITFNDYRKIWIDQIQNVKNIWIYPVDNYDKELNNIKGLLHVYVEKSEYHTNKVIEENENEKIINDIIKIYHQNRNLCEELYAIEIYRPLLLNIECEIVLSDTVDAEEALATILHCVNNHLAPEISYHSLAQLQEEGLSTNEIFNGPNLSNGFIKDESLKEPLSIVNISEVIKAVATLPGIVNINYFSLNYYDETTHKTISIKDHFTVPKNTTVRVTFPTSNKKLVFENSGITFLPDLQETKKQLSFIQALTASKFKAASNSENNIPIPTGRNLDINYHFPIRKQLPEIYGIGDRGISSSATPLRQAQTKQLKAYLLPFDQIIVNFLAQLSNIYSLYDVHGNVSTSYFTNSLPDVEEIIELIEPVNTTFSTEETTRYWNIVTNDLNLFFDNHASERLHKIADQLLARYNEAFQLYSLTKINKNSYNGTIPNESFKSDLLTIKQDFISEYDTISYNRAKSFNYINSEVIDEDTIVITLSGIFKKIAVLTAINHTHITSLSEIITNSGINIHPKQEEIDIVFHEITIETPIEFIEIDEISYLVKNSEDQENLFETMHYAGTEETLLNEVLKDGIAVSNYTIKENVEEELYYILFKGETTKSNVAHIVSTKVAAVETIEKTVEFLTEVSQESEGFFALEHVLLLPSYFENHFGFETDLSLLDDSLSIILTHSEKTTFANRDELLDLLINGLISDELTFKTETITGAYRLSIQSIDGRTIAVSRNDFITKELLEQEIQKLKNIGNQLEKEAVESITTCYVYYGLEPIDESFFSFRMSFILPSWPVRFQNENFQKFFENTVYEEIPIHIRSDIYWPYYNDIQVFETYYFKWLKLLQIQNPEDSVKEEINEYAYELITVLQKLNTEG